MASQTHVAKTDPIHQARQSDTRDLAACVRAAVGERPVTLVGLMGAGKTTVGKRLASRLSLPFVDADAEIETAARLTIPEIFELYGEAEFRATEARVIARLVNEGPRVLATGGGAYMDANTRSRLAEGALTVWLKADLDTLMERVAKRRNRPLLRADDPRAVMARLMAERDPVYAQADITVRTRSVRRDVIAEEVIALLAEHLEVPAPPFPNDEVPPK